MRFKFKFWDKQEKKWASPSQFEIDEDGKIFDLYGEDERYVVQQFIGRTDINGRDIYEGDIVNWREVGSPGLFKFPAAIKFNYGDMIHSLYIPDSVYRQDFNFVDLNSFEVIGNIFENSDLIDASKWKI